MGGLVTQMVEEHQMWGDHETTQSLEIEGSHHYLEAGRTEGRGHWSPGTGVTQ